MPAAHRHKPFLVAVSFLMALYSTFVQGQSMDAVTEHFKRYSQEFTLSAGQPSGEAWTAFIRKAESADVVLIGEDHGFKEIAQLTEAMVPPLHKQGFEHFVTEMDPFTAKMAEAMLQSSDTRALEAHFRDHPYSLPFFTTKEEYAIAKRLKSLLPQGRTNFLWGLDQVFIFQACAVLEHLLPQAKDRKPFDEQLKRCRAEDRKFFANSLSSKPKKGQATYLHGTDAKVFESLRAQLPAGPSTELLDLLRLSQEIYIGQRTNSYVSNRTREELMKTQFDDYLRAAKSWPKFFAKFGAGHLESGRNRLDIMPLGSHIRELAKFHKKTVFSVLILPTPGSKSSTLFGTVGEPYKFPGFEPLFALAKGNRPILVNFADAVQDKDLRATWFQYQDTVKESVASNNLFSFDALILIPQATPATPFVPVP